MQDILKNYLPEGAVQTLVKWLQHYKVHLVITRERHSKLGDYRPPFQGEGHRISINHNLNPYSFLVTMVHEMAHLVTWEKYRDKVQPHGAEWKMNFKKLMYQDNLMACFPADIREELAKYLVNPAARTSGSPALYIALRKYDTHTPTGMIPLDELPLNSKFAIQDGRRFLKNTKLRKFYLCTELHTQKKYRIAPAIMVYPE
jgi:hypothetical protein